MSGNGQGPEGEGRKDHWEDVHRSRQVDALSWYQAIPASSLALIEAAGLDRRAAIVDVGGGASNLVDGLLDAGYRDLTVLDLSAAALEQARKRLGGRAAEVAWVEADVTRWRPSGTFALWHDRGVFHFLTDAARRAAYKATLQAALGADGRAIVATFAADGPQRCSGLPVVRYDADALGRELGDGFALIEARRIEHTTPGGVMQPFTFCLFRRV